MASEAPPDKPVLARQRSAEKHAAVFDDLFAARIAAMSDGIREITTGAPDDVISQVAELGELSMKATGGDDEAKAAVEARGKALAERFETDLTKELTAVWREYDRDGSDSLELAENRELVHAYIMKEKANVGELMRSLVQQSMQGTVNMLQAMSGGEAETPDTNELQDFMDTISNRVVDAVVPAMEEVYDAMAADSDTIADELFELMDTDDDGHVSKDEFTRNFVTMSQQVFNHAGLTERMNSIVQQQIMAQMAGAAGEGGAPGDGECAIM